MEENHRLTLYISYYLARFNNEALKNLGYPTWNIAFDDIAEKLKVKKHSVKNWRDEFDPLFGHRAGWYQRPMTPSRVRVAQALENLNEPQIKSIIKDIISGNILNNKDELEQLLNLVSTDDKKKSNSRFILRTPTGKAAEEFFINFYNEKKQPAEGKLVDCRDLGTGYDFRIENRETLFFVEVKGIAEQEGGILFTDKEWSTANTEKENYYLCIVTNLNSEPGITFIQNPAVKIMPKRTIYTSVQINWIVDHNQLYVLND